MIAIKFDEDKVIHCIQAYEDEHNKKPYLIMCEKTAKILPKLPNTLYVTTNVLTFGESAQDDNVTRRSWNGCKILIDNDIEFGEVHIA